MSDEHHQGARDYVTVGELDARFQTIEAVIARMDRANEVLSATVNRVPTDLQTAIHDLSALIQSQIDSLHREIDKQNENNNQIHLRMDHGADVVHRGLADQVADLKARVNTIEAVKRGAKESRDALYAFIGFGGGVVVSVVAVLAFSTR